MRLAISLLTLTIGPLFAQLSPDQRVHDFQNLSALYAKRYAPANWKIQALGFNLFDLNPWLQRVRDARDDLEFYEICAQYVASLDDLHTSFRVPSSFNANLGLFVDLYDNRTLIEAINRVLLPAALFPFQIGDEIVSVDGQTPEQFISQVSRLRRWGNPLTTRRATVDLLVFRPQSVIPRAVELGETAQVVVRRQSGDVETYTLPWVKSGFPLRVVGPVPTPKAGVRGEKRSEADEIPDYLRPLLEMRNWRVPDDEPLLQGVTYSEETGEWLPRRYLLGWGARAPTFDLPAGFVQRLGRLQTDYMFSGVYPAEGLRIGYLRIPHFAPANALAALREIDTEVAFFNDNTDGLVVDVMRNTGGGCIMLDIAARLIPNTFFFFGEQLRPTIDRINNLNFALEAARRNNAPQWIIETYAWYLDALTSTYRANRALTGPIPACSPVLEGRPATFENEPARNERGEIVAYRKPLIVLIDEFSTSAGDIFPAMLQDNGRGPLVGTRTNGAGGSVSLWPTGFYSEALSSNTNSLVVRRQPIATPDYPTAPYIENIGARADIPLEYMTRDNLLQRGRPFVSGFTRIIVEQIRAGQR